MQNANEKTHRPAHGPLEARSDPLHSGPVTAQHGRVVERVAADACQRRQLHLVGSVCWRTVAGDRPTPNATVGKYDPRTVLAGGPDGIRWRSHHTITGRATHEIWILFDGHATSRSGLPGTRDSSPAQCGCRRSWISHRRSRPYRYDCCRDIAVIHWRSRAAICAATSARISTSSVGGLPPRSAAATEVPSSGCKVALARGTGGSADRSGSIERLICISHSRGGGLRGGLRRCQIEPQLWNISLWAYHREQLEERVTAAVRWIACGTRRKPTDCRLRHATSGSRLLLSDARSQNSRDHSGPVNTISHISSLYENGLIEQAPLLQGPHERA